MKKIKYLILLVMYVTWACNHTNEHGHDHIETNNHDGAVHELEHEHEEEHEQVDEHTEEVPSHHELDSMYGIIEVEERPFYEIIRTSGQILTAQGDEVTLTAVHDGVVVFNDKQLLSGKKVTKGEHLLTISGKELIHDNIEASYLDIKSEFDKASTDYERAVELNRDKIISDKELLDIKLEFEMSKNKFDRVRKNYSTGGQRLTSNISGYVKNIMVSEGQYVVTGQPLLKLTKNKRLVLRADVPQRYFHMLEGMHSANFVTIYDNQLYDIQDLNGRLISFSKSTDENSLFTSVFFEVDNKGSLISGTYVEIFLKTVQLPNCIVVPKSALLEESDRYYVYVEGEEEGFEKRYISIDCNDGANYHVTEGILPGDHIVTKDPYRIKLSMLSNSLPAHSHSH